MRYPLTWLFTAATTDGRTWAQTPADRSVLDPSIWLTPVHGINAGIDPIRPRDPDYRRLLAQIDAGQTVVDYRRVDCRWRMKSAYSDLAGYAARGEVAWFQLAWAGGGGAACRVLLHLADDKAVAGDLECHSPGMPVLHMPFALPERLWGHVAPEDGGAGERRPPLFLHYAREVTVTGTEAEAAITAVEYQIGWRTTVRGEALSHVARLQGGF